MKTKNFIKSLMALSLLLVSGLFALQAQQLAFPDAEGFGAYSKGGRGGDVYHVTNLNDAGAGSLREGISSATGPRTIVFDVSGTIALASVLNVDKPNLTIAGQTAPGDGICLKNYTVKVRARDLIIRHIRVRLGNLESTGDAISIIDGAVNVIVDHCSASWSLDEVLSTSSEFPLIDSVTVSWCIISEALNSTNHSYGSLVRGTEDVKYTYCKNLYAHNRSRNPRPGNYDSNPISQDPLGLHFDFYNNVMYNWMGNEPGYDGDAQSATRYNYVNNYGKPGPESNPTGFAYDAGCTHFKAYYAGNKFYGSIPSDPWTLVDFSGFTEQEIADYKQATPYGSGPQDLLSADQAYSDVLNFAGASLTRDAVDTRVVNDVINGTGAIINTQNDVGGWPTLNSDPAPTDTDQDGMPDSWETARGLNINDASDRNGDDDSDGYTNLEEYLNELTIIPEYTLTVTNGLGDGDYYENTVVPITADNMGAGWAFDEWTGDVAYVDDVNAINANVTMPDQAVSLTATYIEVTTYNLTVNRGTGDGDYQESAVVNIAADAAPIDSMFDAWIGDVSGIADVNDSSTTITIGTSNATITATYKAIPQWSVALSDNFEGGQGNYTFGVDCEVSSAQSHDGSNSAWVKGYAGTNSQIVLTNPIDLSSSTHLKINYWFYADYDTDEGWQIDYYDGSSWTNVVTEIKSGFSILTWTNREVTLSSSQFNFTANAKIRFANYNVSSGSLDYVHLDEIVISTLGGTPAPTYTLTVNSGSGDGNYSEGFEANIAADNVPQQVFVAWTGDVSYVANVNSASTTVTMPAQAVTVTATYEDDLSFDLLTPADASTVGVKLPSFTWGSSLNADNYTLVIDDNADFSSPHLTQTGITAENYTLVSGQELTGDITYNWKVTAYDGGNPTECNNVFSFYTKRNLKSADVSNTNSITDLNFRAFPNPFNSGFDVEFSLETSSQVEMVIFDTQGKQVAQIFDNQLNSGNFMFNVLASQYNLTNGIYLLRLNINGNPSMATILIKE